MVNYRKLVDLVCVWRVGLMVWNHYKTRFLISDISMFMFCIIFHMIRYSHPPHTMIVQKLNLYLFSSFLSVSDLVIGLQPSAIDQCLSGKMDWALSNLAMVGSIVSPPWSSFKNLQHFVVIGEINAAKGIKG